MKTIARTAPLRQEQGTVFRITEQVCGGPRRGKPAPFCDKQGALLTNEIVEKDLWAEHFEEGPGGDSCRLRKTTISEPNHLLNRTA